MAGQNMILNIVRLGLRSNLRFTISDGIKKSNQAYLIKSQKPSLGMQIRIYLRKKQNAMLEFIFFLYLLKKTDQRLIP